jgi:amino acid transporter
MARPEGKPARTIATLRKDCLSSVEDVAQSLGSMAPSGNLGLIFPLLIAKVGNGTWLIEFYCLLAYIPILFCLTRFAGMSASAGSLAEFGRLGLGPWGGILTGWTYVLAMGYAVASAAPCCVYYLDLVIQAITGHMPTEGEAMILTTLLILAAWRCARLDIKVSTELTLVLEMCSVAAMLVIIGVAMVKTHGWVDRPQLRLAGVTPSGLQSGIVLAFLSLAGFESATVLGEEARDAKRLIPRVIMGCLVPVAVFYVILAYCIVSVARRYGIQLDKMDQITAPFEVIARASSLPWLAVASSFGIAMSYFACTLACLSAGSRVLFWIARERLFPSWAAAVHPVTATPYRSIDLFAGAAILASAGPMLLGVSLSGCIDYISQLTSLGFLGAYLEICVASIFYARMRGALSLSGLFWGGAAFVLVGAVLALSVLPVPPAPWRYLPYIFLTTLAGGVAVSAWYYLKRDSEGAGAVLDPDPSPS